MSKSNQPYDASNLPPTWGQINVPALRERINTALKQVEQPRQHQRGFTIERVGNDVKLTCPCGKSLTQSVVFFNAFVRNVQRFFDEHCDCKPGGNS